MRNYIIAVLLLLSTGINYAYCDSIPRQFEMKDGSIRHGMVIEPQANNKKMMVIFVCHRLETMDACRNTFSYLIGKLSDEGISCCFFESKNTEDPKSPAETTLFDVAEDAIEVYNSLKRNKQYKNYKIGFLGVSEAAASSLIAAAKIPKSSFLIQVVGAVAEQPKLDLQVYTVNNPQFSMAITNNFGMSYHDFSCMYQFILEQLKSNDYNNAESLSQLIFEKFSDKVSKNEEQFRPLMKALILKMDHGTISRLNWDSSIYYKDVKCPILYFAASKDNNVQCYSNLFEFEQIMFKNRHRNYSTVLLNAKHDLLPEYIGHKMPKDVDYSIREKAYDIIHEWLKVLIK